MAILGHKGAEGQEETRTLDIFPQDAEDAPPLPPGSVLVGTAGWSYKDWEGIVYPSPAPRGFDPMTFLLGFIDALEINSTFYRPPAPPTARRWARKAGANPRSRLTVKLWRGFTHERAGATGRDVTAFRKGIDPIQEAGRLGCLLLQFPWSFRNNAENRACLGRLLDAFSAYPRAVEIRHLSWNRPDFFRSLAGRNAGFVNIDQPVIGKSLGPTAKASGPVGYVRMHGRNYGDWFREGAGRDARYDYLYGPGELEPWLENIRRVAAESPVTFVILNNHFRGQALVNALQLRHMLGDRVKVPPGLLERYPELREIA
ncbi:MAG: DUF72 domain-containing protein [Nitrospinota bacterium]